MSKYISQKKDSVVNLTNDFQQFDSFCIFSYKSLNSEQFTKLRKDLREIGSKVKVVKNNIINRSLVNSKLIQQANYVGQNAVLFSNNDLKSAQTIDKISGKIKDVQVKAIYFDKQMFVDEDAAKVINLVSKEHLVTKFALNLLNPIHKFLYIIKAINK